MPSPLRGRDNEMQVLAGHLERLRSGTGGVWLIEGGAGLGKSRLVEEASSAARLAGFAVGHAITESGGSTTQLGVLLDALLGGPMPLLDPAALDVPRPSAEQRYWLLQDLEALLEQAALRRPVLVCLDDLQWADSGTAAALRSLPARLATVPVGWVLAARPTDPHSDLGRALAALERGGAARTVLDHLAPDAVADLAADVLGAEPDEEILALAGRSQGSPFSLIELLTGLRDEHLVDLAGPQAALIEHRLPRRVADTMRHRLGRLSPTARQAAAVACCMGRRFNVTDIATVLELTPVSLLDPVTELLTDELFAASGEALSFSHDLHREAVRASQPPSALHALDRQVALTLLGAGALPVEVATRLASSATTGDEVAITTLMKASDALGATDPGEAADLAQRALELTPQLHPLRGPLVARIAVLLHAAGRSNDAKTFADTALRHTLPPEQEADVRLSIAGLFAISPEDRADSCRRALALPGLPPDVRARLLAHLFHNLVVAVRPNDANAVLDEVTATVDAADDSSARFTLELARAGLNYTLDHFDTALGCVDAALHTSSGAGDDSRQRLAQHLRCGILAVMDRYDDAFAAAATSIRAAQQARQGWALHLFETWRGRQLVQLGQLADAAAALEGRYQLDDADRVVGVLDAASVVALGHIAIHTGDQRQTALTAAIAQVMIRSGVPGVEHHAAWLLALQAHAAGDLDQARRWLHALGHEERLTLFPLFPIDPLDDPHLVRLACRTGDSELAEAATVAAEERHRRNPHIPALAASAAHARGLFDGDEDHLQQAVTLLQPGRRRLALASALEDLGALRSHRPEPAHAIAVLDRALLEYSTHAASADAARVRSRLRALGVRRRLLSERRPTHGWDALTDSELAVVRLVVDGLTNRQVAERLYISPHTVGGHLRHAFDKLGINSRVALTRLANEHQ
jgi:DNA-binding CsgD family transcriptional regulator